MIVQQIIQKSIVENLLKIRKILYFFLIIKNSGLSFTRNEALKKATGDYIGYIDSDDYIPKNYYESLMNTILANKADIAVCDIKSVYEKSGQILRSQCGTNENEKIDFINNGLAASACNKLFKKSIISKYKFSEGKVNEDLAVILPTIINSKKVAYDEKTFYNYVQRENSIQNSHLSEKRFDIFYGVDETLKRIKNAPDYNRYKDAIVFQQLIMFFIYVIPKEKSYIKRVKWLKKFNQLSKKYDIRKNQFLWNFLDGQGTKHKYYYKHLLKLNCNGFYHLSSLLINIYNLYKKNISKNNYKRKY